MSYDELNSIIYDRWEKDDCEGIYAEFLWYEVLDKTMRWILGMDDEKITKKAILAIAEHYTHDREVISDARSMSECFEEVL